MTLPTFQPDAHCPKCNSDDVSVSYLPETVYECQSVYAPLSALYEGARACCWYYRGEHLHRVCRRCHYKWAEAVVSPGETRVAESVIAEGPQPEATK